MSKGNVAACRSAMAALVAAILLASGALPTAGATGHITGTLGLREKISLSGSAVAVVSIVDMVAGGNAGVVIGQQRIDGIGEVPLPFSVPIDLRRIDPKHAYGLFATMIDGPLSWQNSQGIAVLTGGPTTGIDAVLPVAAQASAAVAGTITRTDPETLGSDAVAVAAKIFVTCASWCWARAAQRGRSRCNARRKIANAS